MGRGDGERGRKEQRRKGKGKGKEVKEESFFGRKVAGSEKNLTLTLALRTPNIITYNLSR